MQKLRVDSVCPHDMHVFSTFQPCIETRAIDVVSQHASASEMVLQYKGLFRRFCTHIFCFASFLVLLNLVGKRKLFLLCIRLSCTVPLSTALIFSGTSVGPLDTIGKNTARLDCRLPSASPSLHRTTSQIPGAALKYIPISNRPPIEFQT
jgi:hypothetical protein